MTHLVNGQYRIDKRVGRGSFGEVYIGCDVKNKIPVALKITDKDKSHVLKHEYCVYMDIMKSPKTPLIPQIYWYGLHEDKHVLVMSHLGYSLEYLLQNYCAGKFTLKTTLMVGLQIFDLLMRLHSCGYVHRDIKPDNFMIGSGRDKSNIYLIDFGLSKRFKTPDNVHIKSSEGKRLTGTARYASVNSHQRQELSRRDDLESLGYLMIYFLKGRLPWQGVTATDRDEKYKLIGNIKAEYGLDRLCEGVPQEIYKYLSIVRSLKFKEKPDYRFLRQLLIGLFERMGYTYDYHYDWVGSPDSSAF